MTTPRNGKPYVWVTWVTGLLAGEDHCTYAAWFKGHFWFKKIERDFDLAGWKASHAEMVRARAEELRAEGWTVTIEDQNDFKLHGNTATLAGKADIVARRPSEALVVDCKGGKQRDSDYWQVLLYLYALPKLEPEAAVTWRGEVCYSDHRITIQPEELNQLRLNQIFGLMRWVGSASARPAKVPSQRECGFCPIGASDCPERVEQAEAVAQVAEF